MATKFDIPSRIRCLLLVDQETNLWVGHCLDFDLVTSGKNQEIVWKRLKSVVKMHVEHCFSHDKENLHKHRADNELFARFDQIRAANDDEFLSDKIKLNLVAIPNPGDALAKDLSFWIQGVEELASAGANSLQPVH